MVRTAATALPEATPGNHSFIGTTFRADQGLTHVIAAELPLRPLQSLAQLQHFDLTNTNQTSPYAYNVIGNSHAYGMFTPETVYDSSAHASHLPYRFDHSYLANHLLFDDWFISSIAPETGAWSNNTTRSKEEVYQDHLSQSEPLPNTAYRPRTPSQLRNRSGQSRQRRPQPKHCMARHRIRVGSGRHVQHQLHLRACLDRDPAQFT